MSVTAVLRADATRLPFREDAFGAAYARHVLHLMSDWRTAVAELCRVVGRGVILIDAGGPTDRWFDLWLEMRTVLGPEADHVGLDLGREGDEALDAAFLAAGAAKGPVSMFTYPELETVAGALEDTARRSPSWTWRVPDDHARATEGNRWTLDRYGARCWPRRTVRGWRTHPSASQQRRRRRRQRRHHRAHALEPVTVPVLRPARRVEAESAERAVTYRQPGLMRPLSLPHRP